MVKRGNLKEGDVSNKLVFILAIMVVLIVATSTWLVLNKLSGVDFDQADSRTVSITKIVEQGPPSGGVVGLTILEPPVEGAVNSDG